MTTPLDVEIRRSLAQLLSGETTVRQFDDWFTSATWDAEESGDLATIDLVYEVRHRLVEHSSGLWTDEELIGHLRPLMRTYVLTSTPWSDPGDVVVSYGSDVRVTAESRSSFGFVFDTRFAGVSS
jgi:hypothetical protein